MSYRAPLQDMLFVLEHLADIGALGHCADYAESDLSRDGLDVILGEAAKVAERAWASSNRDGDLIGARWRDGEVTTPPSFREAFAVMRDGGWMGTTLPLTWAGSVCPNAWAPR